MRRSSIALALLAHLLLPPLLSGAYQPPSAQPGETWTWSIYCFARWDDEARTVSPRVRVRGHPFWSYPAQSVVVGPWVDLPPMSFETSLEQVTEAALEIPARAAGVLDVEVAVPAGFDGMARADGGTVLVEAPLPARPGGVPFRLVAGGTAAYEPDDEDLGFVLEAVRDAAAWDALRERLGIAAPDSWDLHPDEGDDAPGDLQFADFAAMQAPDFATETLLALRTPEHDARILPMRFCIRSVAEGPDGSVVCRYSWRVRRGRGLSSAYWARGEYLLAAIPATDAPVVFRRVP